MISNDVKLDYSDVLIVPRYSTVASRNDVSLYRTFRFRYGTDWSGIPIIAANMDGVGTLEMDQALDKHRCMVALTKHIEEETLTEHIRKRMNSTIYSMGISDSDFEKFERVVSDRTLSFNMRVCVDVANGYNQAFLDFIKRFREKYPHVILMAGNVVTPEMTEMLILAGVDVVKIGIGPGSVCTTRKMTGVGYPQLSAVLECAQVAHRLKAYIIADGGCTTPGDIAKAFGAGADFVMLGGMLSGHKEGLRSGYTDTVEGKSLIDFYGMSSKTAMDVHNGGVAEYRASEGKHVKLKYRGEVDTTMKEILGGLRSACTYVGAADIEEYTGSVDFVRVNNQINNVFGAG